MCLLLTQEVEGSGAAAAGCGDCPSPSDWLEELPGSCGATAGAAGGGADGVDVHVEDEVGVILCLFVSQLACV